MYVIVCHEDQWKEIAVHPAIYMLSFSFKLIQYINGINVATCLGQGMISTATIFKANAGELHSNLLCFRMSTVWTPAYLMHLAGRVLTSDWSTRLLIMTNCL